ncbi:putative E3 ubiquitin-protein ligase RING1a [Quercus robur]|uniref:RING-type domain-containing protein n=1 Tax=Quercus lobata TaxID=97700 RepID=A0A7N2R4U8_QUELO|nr:putative E3 ubiquitin-protein ligase RING1a [Quercus lobata]XP_030972405.1 putative E3 ubiquitin-protein ligase RING1a [Quercus lobata]XP_050287047.1 putative E3 ubiquitin-protein ligase RING1a [Quercus robur]XP_050287048.1 putative E3 ubiquitin-protein ligase RING1a [Quercus robur]XP_050287049.1 putative E3 ubiquitin-protein ligase RING1a [Quercus robur]
MPSQKRGVEEEEEEEELVEVDDPLEHDHSNHEQHQEEPQESDRSHSSSNGDSKDEFVVVKLSDIRKEVQCPICLGIIRKTRTVMECLHRFCRECIDKSMRLGNNECPACRTHCASRRSLRDDPKYDALISALYPDIDKYEEEELAFHEEERARNKQIQASIAQTFRRQAEALGRKRSTAKATAAAFVRRSRGYRNAHLRGRRNYRNAAESQGSDDNEDANVNDGGKDSSSADEHTEVRPKRSKRWGGVRFSLPSPAAASADGGGDENDSEVNRESIGVSAGLVGSSERLAWGKGGMRSHTRYGSMNGGNGKNARNSRLSKLAEYLRNLEENDNELTINLMLVSFDEQSIPSLERPYLCCKPTLSVRQLRKYVAVQTASQDDEVVLYLVNELDSKINPATSSSETLPKSHVINPGKDKLRILGEQETLAGLKTGNFVHGYLLLAYERKQWHSDFLMGLS